MSVEIHPGARACAVWWANLLRQTPKAPPSTEIGALPPPKSQLLNSLVGRLRSNAQAITEEQLDELEQRLALWFNQRVPEPGCTLRLNALRTYVDYDPCPVLRDIAKDLGMGDLKYIWPMKALTYLYHEKVEARLGHAGDMETIWEAETEG